MIDIDSRYGGDFWSDQIFFEFKNSMSIWRFGDANFQSGIFAARNGLITQDANIEWE